MKKLRLFLTGILAAAVAVGGVNADETVQIFEACVADTTKAVCELTEDVTLTKHLMITTDKTLKLNGHKLSAGTNVGVIYAKNGSHVVIDGGNGTIDYSNYNGVTRMAVYENSSLDIDNVTIDVVEKESDNKNTGLILVQAGQTGNATLNIGKNTVITSTDTIVSVDLANAQNTAVGNANVTIAGKLTADGNAVTINGNVKESAFPARILVEGTAEITSKAGAGAYAAGYGFWTFEEGAKVTGQDAISIKSGSITINGGEYNATGKWNGSPDKDNNGSEITGSAVSVTSNSNYAGDIRININGGKFTAKEGCAFYEYTSDPGTKLIQLSITDGDFVAGTKVSNVISLKKATLTKFIEGGTYSGKKASSKLDGKYVNGDVKKVNGVNYVGEATEAIHKIKVALVQPDGQTVEIEGSYDAVAGNKISLTKLFGFDITKYTDYTVTYVVKNAEGTELARLSASYLKGADGKYAAAYDDEFTMTAADVNVEIIFSKNGKVVAPDEPVMPDNEITTEIPSADDVVTTDEETSKVLTETLKNTEDEELKELLEENDVTVALEAKEVEVSEDEEKKFAEALPNATISKYLDINVLVKAGETTLNLHELDEEITLTVKIPENLPEVKEGYTRVYYILREHDGKVETLKTVLSEDGTELSFATDKFSTYALAYEDQANAGTNPDTLDNIGSYLMISAIACTGLVALGYSIKKKLEN